MTNGVPQNQGNSRKLKSGSVPATFDAFRTALLNGTLLVDLGINEAGWAQLGTKIDKNSLLKDATAALLQLPASAVPDEALHALATKSHAVLASNETEAAALSAANPDIFYGFE